MQSKAQSRVWIIVDKQFGEQLTKLPQKGAIWIIASPTNTPVVHLRWQKDLSTYHPHLTIFKANEADTAEEALLAILGIVDEHHGYTSFEVPYGELEIVGCQLSPEIHLALDDLGLGFTSNTITGFIASRLRGCWGIR